MDKTSETTDNFMTLPVFNARPEGTAAVHHDTAKKGFTVVELMVVIGIIGMLMGLLLPAVQSAREAGRRNACGNNIRQIGLAVVDYGMKKSRLPGWRNAHPNNGFPANSVTWAIPILPQLERNDIYETYRTGLGAPQQISLFLCPSKGSRDAGDTVIDYGANAGSTMVTVFPGGTQFNGDGVFYDTLGDVVNAPANYTKLTKSLDTISEKDGTTTTLLFAESPIGRDYRGVPSRAGGFEIPQIPNPSGLPSGPGGSTDVPIFGVLITGIPDRPINPALAAIKNERPGSLHPGGAMVAFCDGHTKFVGNELANHVFIQLMTSDMTWNGATNNYTNATNGISAQVNMTMKAAVLQANALDPNVKNPYVLREADIP